MAFDVVELATSVMALAGIAGLGYAAGQKFGDRKEAEKAKKETDAAQTLLEAARSEGARFREESLKWERRFKQLNATEKRPDPLEEVRSRIADPTTLWLRTPTRKEVSFQESRRCLLVSNLKGGVGKSTIATHLAVEMGLRGKRVLFIDLDFQGSGSTTLLTHANRLDLVENSPRDRSSAFIEFSNEPRTLSGLPLPLGDKGANVEVLSAHYGLSDAEEKLMLRWLIGDEPEDIRYNLLRNMQGGASSHDLVIIDAPPRLSTAMAQAIVASTHILIPTLLDGKSVEAVRYFLGQLQTFSKRGVCEPCVIGVLPNMVGANTNYDEARSDLRRHAAAYRDESLVWTEQELPNLVAFQRLPLVQALPQHQGASAQAAIRKLADRVSRSLWP